VQKASEKDAPLKPFTITLDDPAGNSFIEFIGSMSDPKWNLRTYKRTRQHNIALGLIAPDEPQVESETTEKTEEEQVGGGLEGPNEEIFIFPGECSSCGHKSDTLVKKVNIPYFKDILIMSVNCDLCGYRDNEVKSGSAISPLGKKITLKVEDKEDLSRDILKVRTIRLSVPTFRLSSPPERILRSRYPRD
jgi:zinc finger protein